MDLKESNPVELAKFSVTQGIDHEPAFCWWVPYILKKRDRIIAAVNKCYHKCTHKFGIQLPKSVEEAKQIDEENGDTHWQDAINKEMKAVRVAFNILGEDAKAPVEHQFIGCHMVFDVKMEDFRCKVHYVAKETTQRHLQPLPMQV